MNPISVKLITIVMLAFGLTATAAVSTAPDGRAIFQWSNPIYFEGRGGDIGRSAVRDPVIIRDGNTYYLVYTVWPFANREEKRMSLPDRGSSPGIKMFSSRDLKTWVFEKWLLKSSDLPENCPYKHRFWAPEIHKINGKFYLVFTADNWLKNEYNSAGRWGTAGWAFVGVADKITGPYEHITWIPGTGCDTTLFGDTNGQTYAFTPRGNIEMQEIDLSKLTEGKVSLLGLPQQVISCDNSDIGMKSHPEYLEGPWVTRTAGKYYLFYAAPYSEKKFPAEQGYWTGVAYADNIKGPWTKDKRGRVFLGGHLAVFEGPDGRNWFSYRGEGIGPTFGYLCIDPYDIGPNGEVNPSPSLPLTAR